jgi:hypothetical protein
VSGREGPPQVRVEFVTMDGPEGQALVIVLLSATDYAVSRASKVPRYVVESSAIYRQHVNGNVLFARPEIMSHPDATDLTAALRATQTGRRTV